MPNKRRRLRLTLTISASISHGAPYPPQPDANPAGKNAGIISPSDYDQGAASWLLAVSDSASTVLAQSFNLSAGLLSALSFSAWQIARLVSRVGASIINARFLLLHDAQARPHFSVAPFATDALETRVSSYYLAQSYLLPQSVANAAGGGAQAAGWRSSPARALARYDVPDVLTQQWLNNCGRVRRVTPELFATSHGPLRGYSYGVEEFAGLQLARWKQNPAGI